MLPPAVECCIASAGASSRAHADPGQDRCGKWNYVPEGTETDKVETSDGIRILHSQPDETVTHSCF